MILLLLGLISAICMYLRYIFAGRQLKDVSNPNNTSNKFFKSIKKRYMDCFTLGKPIHNSKSFVEKSYYTNVKYLNRLNTAGFVFQMCFFLLLIHYHYTRLLSSENAILIGLLSFILFITLYFILDTKTIEEAALCTICDYLDNTLSNRLLNTSKGKEPAKSELAEVRKSNGDFAYHSEHDIISSIVNEFL